MIAEKRRQKLLWEIPLAVAILVAIFWGIWHLISGNVPETTGIEVIKAKIIVLPFAISRWWDTFFGTILAFLIVWVATNQKIKKYANLASFLLWSLISVLIFGLVFGLIYGLIISLILGLILGLMFLLALSICGLESLIELIASKKI